MIRRTGSFAMVALAVSSAAGAAQGAPRAFSSPEQAAEALFVAVQGGDDQALAQLFGGNRQVLSCGDELQDDQDRRMFVAKYREMHRIGRNDDLAVLYVGAENWPFPVPLASRNGSWVFDTQNGKEEILLRRIGENELSAIDVSRAIGGFDSEDASRVLGSKVALNGYFFRKVEGTARRPSFVAYPAEYGSSGIMTFIVGPDDVVYERDLGPGTAKIASAMKSFQLDGSWHAVQ
jgi:DUF2950 family protein